MRDILDHWPNGSAEPLQKIRPIVGPVNPMPCSNDRCPGLTVLGGDDDPDLMTVLELYRGCVIRVTIELVEGPQRRPEGRGDDPMHDLTPIEPNDIAWVEEGAEGAQSIRADAVARILNEMREEIQRLRALVEGPRP